MAFRGLSISLLLIVTSLGAHAQRLHINLVGVRRPAECAGPLNALQAELRDLPFPDGWTIVVACTPVAWEGLLRQVGNPPTHTAFTSTVTRITVLNGAIFSGLRTEYRWTIAHELGHILCDCRNELQADARAGNLLDGREVAPWFPAALYAEAFSRPASEECRGHLPLRADSLR